MARGWESKSVEAQIDMAETQVSSAVSAKMLSSKELELVRKKEGIALSRTRIVRELSTAQNPRYKGILNKALADLDAQLATFA
jgi:hypothetical protein